ncbi:MAG TPA: hypothetical protein EYP36_02920 [Calditrichaeota bacterium]|nr:hypothetical protein [Calditrichota bacterium]
MSQKHTIFLFILLLFIITRAQQGSVPSEFPVVPLPLGGPLAAKSSEISGLAWYGDRLIILPQYPDKEKNSLFFIKRTGVEKSIDNLNQIPLAGDGVSVNFNNRVVKGMPASVEWELIPERIAVDFNGLFNTIGGGYEGFESIAFIDSLTFLTIECKEGENTFAWIIRGQMSPDASHLVLEPSTLKKIQPQAHLRNFSDEALVCYRNEVYTFYEANGQNVNPHPVVHHFNSQLQPLGVIPFTTLEYRLTDATAVDEQGRFWVANYLWAKERDKLNPAEDVLITRYGRGKTHQKNPAIERLVEFQIYKNKIDRTDRPPLQLQLLRDDSRNWEGIVRLPGRGFLLATDRFPKTILAFVPFPNL